MSGRPVERIHADGREPLRCCLHARDCGGPARTEEYPREWLSRPQVLRAYDHRGWTTLYDGTHPVAALGEVPAAPGVVEVHSRNVAYGCFMFAATAG
ncbi:DUF1203 domain-containing protein [Amycolatopsis thermoflava]|uniref:DUF1203 domain-containing protein n=1 Tax=Amycolatopsis thermoflava TaxID=84480 RepID=UPI0036588D84